MMPKRIQRKRTKGWKKPDGCVNVTRPGKLGVFIRDSDEGACCDAGQALAIIAERDARIAALEAALIEIDDLNPLRTDLDAYLSEVIWFSLGKSENKPTRADYGIE